jgi:hypothetical protein
LLFEGGGLPGHVLMRGSQSFADQQETNVAL